MRLAYGYNSVNGMLMDGWMGRFFFYHFADTSLFKEKVLMLAGCLSLFCTFSPEIQILRGGGREGEISAAISLEESHFTSQKLDIFFFVYISN